MSDTSLPWKLGAGTLASAAIRVFRDNPIPFAVMALLPWLLRLALTLALPAEQVETPLNTPGDIGPVLVEGLPWMVLELFLWVLAAVPACLMTFAIASGRKMRLAEAYTGMIPVLGRALGLTLLQWLALVPLGLLVFALIRIGVPVVISFVASAAMALWVVAVLFLAMPAAVAGAGPVAALRRSAALSKDHRWAMVGSLLALVLFVFVIGLVIMTVLNLLMTVTGTAAYSSMMEDAVSTVLSAPLSILPTLLYLRLQEMKEGGDTRQIAEVFE